jgi:hypothetical protein
MRVLGRILQAIGWVWVIVGFIGPMFGWNAPNFFPGIILLFVSRIFRAQGSRQSPSDEAADTPAQPERILNTDRLQPPAPPPAASHPVPGKPQPIFEKPETSEIESDPEDGLLERVLLAGLAPSEEMDDRPEPDALIGDGQPKSSQDMIAEARKRWGKRP